MTTIKIHNVATNQLETREMNEEELAFYDKIVELQTKNNLEAQNKVAAKKALLEKLGITEQEANLLFEPILMDETNDMPQVNPMLGFDS